MFSYKAKGSGSSKGMAGTDNIVCYQGLCVHSELLREGGNRYKLHELCLFICRVSLSMFPLFPPTCSNSSPARHNLCNVTCSSDI